MINWNDQNHKCEYHLSILFLTDIIMEKINYCKAHSIRKSLINSAACSQDDNLEKLSTKLNTEFMPICMLIMCFHLRNKIYTIVTFVMAFIVSQRIIRLRYIMQGISI